jgi:hypothetical protein
MVFAALSEIGIEFAALGGIPAYLLLQGWTLKHLSRGPRYAALLPMLLAFSVIAPCFDTAAGRGGPSPTALLLFAPGAALYLLGLAGYAHLSDRLRARLAALPTPAGAADIPDDLDPALALAV